MNSRELIEFLLVAPDGPGDSRHVPIRLAELMNRTEQTAVDKKEKKGQKTVEGRNRVAAQKCMHISDEGNQSSGKCFI
jgi:hypothetical protein